MCGKEQGSNGHHHTDKTLSSQHSPAAGGKGRRGSWRCWLLFPPLQVVAIPGRAGAAAGLLGARLPSAEIKDKRNARACWRLQKNFRKAFMPAVLICNSA